LPEPRIFLSTAATRSEKLLLAGTLAVCLLIMSAQAREGGKGRSLLERIGLSILSPVVRGTQKTAKAERSAADAVSSYFRARSENRELRKEIAGLKREAFLLRAGAEDSGRLRELLRIQPFLPSVRLGAAIVSIEARGAYRRGLLAAGSRDGVRPGSPLAVTDGLIGRVITVTPGLSKVILIGDSDCAIGGRVVRTGDQGVVRGQGETLRMEYLSTISRIVPGDLIETAGIDGIFPRGIPIGRITEISSDKSLFLKVQIAPSAPISRISDVLVLDPSPVVADEHP
jgi:rod shape-determining protein MreC